MHDRINKLISLQDIQHLSLDNTAFDAATLMEKKRIGSVLIYDQEKLVGIFSERDMINRVVAKSLDPKKTLLKEVCTYNPQVISGDQNVEDCYHKMKAASCRHLPLERDHKIVAVVSILHVLNWTIDELREECDHLKNYIQN